MAVGIVDALEVVQIDHQQRDGLLAVARLREQVFEGFAEVGAIVEFGQPVQLAELAQAQVRGFQLLQRAAQLAGALFDLDFQLVARFAHDPLVLVAQRGVAVAQRDRQQQHFQGRTDLHAVLGDEVLGQRAEGDHRDHRDARQEHRPGQQEQLGRLVAAAHGNHRLDRDPGHAQDHRDHRQLGG